jgi:hypothetical protein
MIGGAIAMVFGAFVMVITGIAMPFIALIKPEAIDTRKGVRINWKA